MPAIAADSAQYHPAFYLHLGDLRAIYEVDEDYAGQLDANGKLRVLDLKAYQNAAWDDFIQMQIQPFKARQVPFFIGIGNHESIPPKTRDQFVTQFAEWLNNPILLEQRRKDADLASSSGKAPSGNQLQPPRTYYHWTMDGIDFIYLDNSTDDQFDRAQMDWLHERLEYDRSSQDIHTIIVGMHKTLPQSFSNFHSMSESPVGQQSGRCVYRQLEKIQREDHKHVAVLSSHSHFIMTDVYDTPFWQQRAASVVPGILIGTAGAVRYRSPVPPPPGHESAEACIRDGLPLCAQTDVYGYLLGTVNANGKPGTVQFQFKEIKKDQVPLETQQKFSADTVKVCFEQNKQLTPATDDTQYLPDGPCPY